MTDRDTSGPAGPSGSSRPDWETAPSWDNQQFEGPATGMPPWTPLPPRNRRPLIIGVVVVAVLLVAGGAAAVVLRGRDGNEPAVFAEPTVTETAAPGPTVTTETPSPSPTPTVTVTTETPAADPEAAALAELTALRSQDASAVTFDGRYAAQLASKSVGIVDPLQTTESGSHRFGAADILAEHQAIRNALSGQARIVLVLSTDYGKRQLYQGKPLWITFALGRFPTKQSVVSWCAGQFPQFTGDELKNHCDARKLNP
nr:hypothetical protein [uncultured Actinoplanes sp.]